MVTPKLGASWVSTTKPLICSLFYKAGDRAPGCAAAPPRCGGGDRQIYFRASKSKHHSRVHSDLSANDSFPAPLP